MIEDFDEYESKTKPDNSLSKSIWFFAKKVNCKDYMNNTTCKWNKKATRNNCKCLFKPAINQSYYI